VGKSQSVTTGYKYYFDIQMGLGRGPLDAILQILVGDVKLYDGEIDGAASGSFDSPDLLGGDKGEGGIVGSWQSFPGDAAQVYPDSIKTELGGLVPDFRGVHTFWYSGQVCSNNPYPKAWKFRVVRNKAGWVNNTPWYPAKAEIVLPGVTGENGAIRAMNPAHIIYECATNPDWGRGLDPALIDEPSFIEAANTLCSENFGLCLAWNRQTDLNAFVQTVVNHIGASIFTDRRTGLLSIRLIRGDYIPGDLPVFDATSGLLSIDDSADGSTTVAINEVVVQYINPLDKGKQAQARAHSLGAIQANGGAVNSVTTQYDGIATFALAERIALRDLRVATSGAKNFNLTFDRRGWKIYPGMPFRISAPERGISDMILRAASVKDSSLTDGKITVGAAQDVFGMPSTGYQKPETNSWTPPTRQPLRIDTRVVLEANYRDLARNLSPADREAFPASSGAVLGMGAKPNGSTLNYVFMSATDGINFQDRGNADFTGYSTLVGDIDFYDTTMTVDSMPFGLAPSVGDGAYINGEYIEITAIDGLVLTIARGCADTLPKQHTSGAIVWYSDGPQGTDHQEYGASEVVSVKMLSRTLTGILNVNIADADAVTIAARQNMPYVPGNMRVQWTDEYSVAQDKPALTFTDYIINDFTFSWANRNRLTQLDQLISHTEASISPEAGQTVTIYIYDGTSGSLLDTKTGITGTSWTFDATEDSAIGFPGFIVFKIVAARDGIESFDSYSIRVARGPGWGNDWGFGWGN
jgi:hypothetical protein